jgi:hypothetical protein
VTPRLPEPRGTYVWELDPDYGPGTPRPDTTTIDYKYVSSVRTVLLAFVLYRADFPGYKVARFCDASGLADASPLERAFATVDEAKAYVESIIALEAL